MRTGQRPMSVINYPSVAAALAKELADRGRQLAAVYQRGAESRAGAGRVWARVSGAEVRAAGRGGRKQHVAPARRWPAATVMPS